MFKFSTKILNYHGKSQVLEKIHLLKSNLLHLSSPCSFRGPSRGSFFFFCKVFKILTNHSSDKYELPKDPRGQVGEPIKATTTREQRKRKKEKKKGGRAQVRARPQRLRQPVLPQGEALRKGAAGVVPLSWEVGDGDQRGTVTAKSNDAE